jgi:hypothetical protein
MPEEIKKKQREPLKRELPGAKIDLRRILAEKMFVDARYRKRPIAIPKNFSSISQNTTSEKNRATNGCRC